MTYNSQNRLTAVTFQEPNVLATETFTYNGKSLWIAWNSVFTGAADSILYDDSSRISYIAAMLGTDTTHLYFYYNANGELTMSTAQHQPNDPVTVSTYQYDANGDISTEFDSTQGLPGLTGTIYYRYYTDKAFEQGDYIGWQEFTGYGVVFWKSAHLVESIGSVSIVYSFDADGRITGFSTTGASANSEQTQFVYPCTP